jgi:osmotically-inducible protein OsmY
MNIGSSLSFSERADNLLFETRLENRLLFESGIYSNNYSIDVVNGNVYVMGTASSIEEKTKLENFLGEMKDIGKLVTIVSLPSKNLNKKNEK